MTWYSQKMLISNRCICGLMPNLIKKSWTVSNMYTVTFGQKSSKLNSWPVYCPRLYCTRILESILYMGFIRFSGMNFSYVRLVVKNYLETLSFPEDCFSSELTTLHRPNFSVGLWGHFCLVHLLHQNLFLGLLKFLS